MESISFLKNLLDDCQYDPFFKALNTVIYRHKKDMYFDFWYTYIELDSDTTGRMICAIDIRTIPLFSSADFFKLMPDNRGAYVSDLIKKAQKESFITDDMFVPYDYETYKEKLK